MKKLQPISYSATVDSYLSLEHPSSTDQIRALLAALLARSILDLTGANIADRESAAEYFFKEDYEAPLHYFTFRRVCEILDLNIDRMREALKNQFPELKDIRAVNHARLIVAPGKRIKIKGRIGYGIRPRLKSKGAVGF